MIYIVIPVFNRLNYTKECIESLLNQTYKDFKVVVVDHGSTDGTDIYIQENFTEVVLLKGDSNMWWTGATNLGVKYVLDVSESENDFILTLNNDLIVKENYLNEMYLTSLIYHKHLIGSFSVSIEDYETIVFAGVNWNRLTASYTSKCKSMDRYIAEKSKNLIIKTDLLPGRGTLIPLIVFKKIGLFDVNNFPHYMADEDFCLRAKYIGFESILSDSIVVFSHINATGLNTSVFNNKIQYLANVFTSIKSPNNLYFRWRWARIHASFPPLYFFLDTARVFKSQLTKLFSNK